MSEKEAKARIKINRLLVGAIEAEQALVDANRELINRFEVKIQQTIARVWGEKMSTKSSINPIDILTRLDWTESEELELKAAKGELPEKKLITPVAR